jgi:hypothetical protein
LLGFVVPPKVKQISQRFAALQIYS